MTLTMTVSKHCGRGMKLRGRWNISHMQFYKDVPGGIKGLKNTS